MTPIVPEKYFGEYADSPDANAAVHMATVDMLIKVNELRAVALEAGVPEHINPFNASPVSGNGHGGFRDQACTIGATHSTHKTGHGVDVYDPHRELATWCVYNLDELRARGLHMEDPRWTPTWVHLQDIAPGNPPVPAKTVYIPSMAPALAKALPGQVVA